MTSPRTRPARPLIAEKTRQELGWLLRELGNSKAITAAFADAGLPEPLPPAQARVQRQQLWKLIMRHLDAVDWADPGQVDAVFALCTQALRLERARPTFDDTAYPDTLTFQRYQRALQADGYTIRTDLLTIEPLTDPYNAVPVDPQTVLADSEAGFRNAVAAVLATAQTVAKRLGDGGPVPSEHSDHVYSWQFSRAAQGLLMRAAACEALRLARVDGVAEFNHEAFLQLTSAADLLMRLADADRHRYRLPAEGQVAAPPIAGPLAQAIATAWSDAAMYVLSLSLDT